MTGSPAGANDPGTDGAWEFGEAALDQTVELAGLVRRVSGMAMALEADDPAVAVLIDQLRVAERALEAVVPPSTRPRVGPNVGDEGRVYLDHSRDVGAFNPTFPEYEITVDGNRATGTIEFPLLYEGPPGLVHGGVLANFFDCVIQQHNCVVGVAGETTSLEVLYRRPTRLLVPHTFEIDRTTDGEEIASTARLLRDGHVCVTALMRTHVRPRHALPAVSPRRS